MASAPPAVSSGTTPAYCSPPRRATITPCAVWVENGNGRFRAEALSRSPAASENRPSYLWGCVEQWDADSGKKVRQIVWYNRDDYSPDEHDVAMPFVLSPDGKWLAAGQGKRVVVHEDATGKRVHEFAGHQKAVTALAFSSDSQRLVSGRIEGTLVVWSLAAGQSRK